MSLSQNILCLPHSPASFSEMLEIARPLHANGIYRPVFVFDGPGYTAASAVCEQAGIAYHGLGSASSQAQIEGQALPPAAQAPSHSTLARLFTWAKKTFPAQFAFALLQYGRVWWRARRLLDEIQPRALLLIGDRHIGLETALVTQANRRGIPSLIVPFALSDRESGVIYRQAAPDWRRRYGMSGWLNRMMVRLRPGWSFTHGGETLLWQPPAALLAAAFWGLMPKNPWVLGGGAAWGMAVENQHARNDFIDQGVPRQKIFVTGKARYDRAAKIWQQRRTARQRLCAEWGLDAEKKLLVCAVPQFGEHDLLPWEQHWREIEFLFQSFAALMPHTNVVLSLHPKSDPAQYAPRAEKHGLLIAQQRYDQLIPISDLLVASYSSTVTLAIAAHVPVVVFDFHNFDYDFFDQVRGIQIVKQREEFQPALQRVLNDPAYYQQLVDGQAQAAEVWARFDGQAAQRTLDFLDELIARGRTARQLPPRQRRQALPPWSR